MELKLENITLKNNAKYVIYGFSEAGILLCKTLQLLGNEVCAFICSKGYKKFDRVAGIKVYIDTEYMTYHFQKDGRPIILNTVQQVQVAQSVERRFKNIEEGNLFYQINTISDWLKIHILFYKTYFKNKGIDISKKFLEIEGYTFINPFTTNDRHYSWSFLLECCDLILPALFNDISMVFEGPYEYENVQVEKNDIVIDCGSNIGLFANIAAKKCKKVYAFEPIEKTSKYIDTITKLYGNIEICKYACGDKKGIVNFSNSDDNNVNCIVSEETVESIRVPMIDLDSFVRDNNIERVDFIKADIEGAERDMLKGAQWILSEFAPKLSICEYHLPDDPQVLERLILEANPNYIVKHEYMKIHAYVPNR